MEFFDQIQLSYIDPILLFVLLFTYLWELKWDTL